MKSRTLTCIAAITLFAALAVPVRLAAQDKQEHSKKHKHHHYQVIDIGTFGGPQSYFNSLNLTDVFGFGTVFDNLAQVRNAQGVFVGFADTNAPDPYPAFCYVPDCFVTHAFQLRNGIKTDLGTLPGGASSAAFWINAKGWITGNSENGETDPLIPGLPEVRAVLWKHGKIQDLGTLGGSSSFSQAVNNRGQVTGLALNGIPDPFSFYYQFLYCFPFQICPPNATETRAFVWDEEDGMQDIGTLGGPDAFPSLINQRGQVAGFSYTNSTPDPNTGLPTYHPFLWEKGTGMKDLGSFGGAATASVNGLNERGEVVGGLDLPGDQDLHPFVWDGEKLIDLTAPPFDVSGHGEAAWINEAGEVVGSADIPVTCLGSNPPRQVSHAFLWKNGVMMDLGTVDGISNSGANFINSKTQIVGFSFACDFSALTAFLWEKGSIVDLNTLVSPNSQFYLYWAGFIDDRGEIGAFGALSNGDSHAVLLVPCDENQTNTEGCEDHTEDGAEVQGETNQRPNVILPEYVRKMLRERLGFGRFLGTRQKLALSGAAAISGPNATLSPTSLTFSTQAIGTTSAAKTVTLKNTGTTSLTISSIAITGTNAGNFAQTHTCGSSLAAGASCTVCVTFKPTACGSRMAALSIPDRASGSPQIASLSGMGVVSGPNATLSPTCVTFAAQLVGTTSPGKSFTLTNFGSTTLSITSITASGDFSQTHSCGSSVAPLASCTISVTFKPTQIGTRTGTLSIADNAPGSPQSVALSGTGVVSGPNATLSPTSLIFACRNIIGDGCGCHTLATPTLTNFGSTTLSITGIGITGAAFSETNNCDTNLGAGKSCTITVKWMPPSSSFSFGTVSVSDNASGSPQTVSLEGLKECTPP